MKSIICLAILGLLATACGLLVAGLAGCRSKPCDPTAWQKGSITGLDEHLRVEHEAPWDMTPDQVCDCLREYLRSHVGSDNTLIEGGSHSSLEGGMREVDFWAFAYGQLVGHELKVPYGAGWAERDKLIREMLKYRPSREVVKTRYFPIFLAAAVEKQRVACEMLSACTDEAQLERAWPEIHAVETELRDHTLEYAKFFNEQGLMLFIYILNDTVEDLNEVLHRIEDGEETSGIRDMMSRVLRYYERMHSAFTADLE